MVWAPLLMATLRVDGVGTLTYGHSKSSMVWAPLLMTTLRVDGVGTLTYDHSKS